MEMYAPTYKGWSVCMVGADRSRAQTGSTTMSMHATNSEWWVGGQGTRWSAGVTWFGIQKISGENGGSFHGGRGVRTLGEGGELGEKRGDLGN